MVVDAKLIYKGDEKTHKTLTLELIEFEVALAVNDWKDHRRGYFEIQILLDIECNGTYKLTTQSENRDLHPLLVVYSYDPNQELSEVITSIENAAKENKGRTKRAQSVATPVNNNNPNRCEMITVDITKDRFNSILSSRGRELLFPLKVSLNSCGGSCDNELSTYPHHAAILSLFLREEPDHEQVKYQKHCIPTEYYPMVVITRSTFDQRTTEILSLSSGTVRRCDCLNTYVNTTST